MGFKKYKNQKSKRKLRVRKKLKSFGSRYRLSVFRSNKYHYVQVINDETRETLISASETDLTKEEKTKTKTERAYLIGKYIAKKSQGKKIKKVVFDRGAYRYHGRVKSLAEGARKGGLEF